LETKRAAKPPATRFKDLKNNSVNASDFDLNKKLSLAATQQCGGGGLTKAKVYSGVLGMHMDALKGRWSDISEVVGSRVKID
jgi:hypothetical protein